MTEDSAMSAPNVTPKPRWPTWLGLVLHLALAVFPYSATGLLAPLYGIVLAFVGWFVLLGLALKWWKATPMRLLLVPVLAVAYWFALMFFGDFVLGWTA